MAVMNGTPNLRLFLQRKLYLLRMSHLTLLFSVAAQERRDRLLWKGELSVCSNSPAFRSFACFPKLHLLQSGARGAHIPSFPRFLCRWLRLHNKQLRSCLYFDLIWTKLMAVVTLRLTVLIFALPFFTDNMANSLDFSISWDLEVLGNVIKKKEWFRGLLHLSADCPFAVIGLRCKTSRRCSLTHWQNFLLGLPRMKSMPVFKSSSYA